MHDATVKLLLYCDTAGSHRSVDASQRRYEASKDGKGKKGADKGKGKKGKGRVKGNKGRGKY